MKAKHLLIAMFLSALLAVVVSIGCNTTGGAVSQEDNIATACETSAAGLDAVTAAFLAGRVKRDVLERALVVHRSTKPWCRPVATSLSPDDYGKLIRAASELSALGSTK